MADAAPEQVRCPRCLGRFDAAKKWCPEDGAKLVRDLSGRSVSASALGRSYKLGVPLGRGAFGAVFRASQTQPPTAQANDLAVKVLHPDLAAKPELRSRFQRELRAVAQIDHPNAVRLVDQGQDPTLGPYVVMPLLRGNALPELQNAAGGRLAWREIWPIVDQTLAGLHAAHAVGVVHRDLKPENIMVHRPDFEQLHVWILDFGLAKLTRPPMRHTTRLQGLVGSDVMTRPEQVVGSPAYMSPEQVMNTGLDGRADLYSVGVVLFELLTGRLPFDHETNEAFWQAHVFEAPKPPSLLTSWVSPDLDGYVLQLLAKRPSQRPSTALAAQEAWRALGIRPK